MKKRKNKKEYFFAVKFSLSRFFCAELTGCTDVLHVPFIELSLALNSAGFFAVQRSSEKGIILYG